VQRRVANGAPAGPSSGVARGAAVPPAGPLVATPIEERPILAVSTDQITLSDVDPAEDLPDEVIDVFNQGGGVLEWTVSCDDDWITVEQHRGFFTVRFSPRPGMNRGRIYVRERSGATRRIPVEVRVKESPPPPVLVVSQESVEFGTISRDGRSPRQTIQLINAGAGQLNPRVTSRGDWLEVKRTGDLVEVVASTKGSGDLRGEILIESDGGERRIPVTARIDAGPVLEVDSKRISFGTVPEDHDDEVRTLRVHNAGDGRLEWDFTVHGDFFTVDRTSSGLRIELDADVGRHRGSIFISSNGGEMTIDVDAEVEWSPHQPSGAFVPAGVEIAGTWAAAGIGSFVFVGSHPNYSYTEFNMLGIACGQGSAVVQGGSVQLHGYNIIAGPVQGWLNADAQTMVGTVAGQMESVPIMLSRQLSSESTSFGMFNSIR